MFYIGIDIGSTASKVTVFEKDSLKLNFTMPTGWSSVETSKNIKDKLEDEGIKLEDSVIVATGYGRVAVPYANKTITEITCHGKGTYYLLGKDCTVIDIGGQDTKIITIKNGKVINFTMNDKCAAGTGRFLELMANTLGVSIGELGNLALKGENINITNMCTVFAESEVISLIGSGAKREDISRGVINSITGRVYSMLNKHGVTDTVFLTGGLCEVVSFVELLSEKINNKVETDPLARYAGSIGAALLAME
ncbi:CoA activase [Tissierella sp. MSJ-40]|uniref:CoA activase n=1 Tax=Tissierella simiarum TaxID=2841534 RepID=A0ABS6EAE9_9FIRM|nr:acyl-CoA dehydratase activase [Tissierella simiarum]MBU5439904.1 CoA activase [Tissierella simiarum]